MKTGSLEAKDKREVSKKLHEEGFVLISATEATSKKGQKKSKEFSFDLPFFGGVKLTEKMMFARHLAVMIGAGLSLDRALSVLSDQTQNKEFKKVISQVEDSIRRGEAFADSLEKHPKVFNELFVNMVRVGEESGTLENVLKVLARQMKKDHEIISSVRGAMIYPAIIISVMFGIGILMMILVVPRLSEVFSDLEVELPFTTRVIIAIGEFAAANSILVLIAIVAFVVGLRFFVASRNGKRVLDWVTLNAPIISNITKQVNAARFSRTLSSLTKSGVPILRSLEILSGTLTNHYYKESIAQATQDIKKGEPLHSTLEKYKELYPPIVVQMVAVGEETGALAEIMQRLAVFYETEVTNITRNLSSIIEPVLMVVIGAAVGFFAISMIQPMYSMMGSI